MLSLTRKQTMVLLIVLVSIILALAASTAIIQVINPNFFHHAQQTAAYGFPFP
jgi:hypothetical protein